MACAQPTILVFGDSLSAGYGIPRETAWPTLLQHELQITHPQYQVVNASTSGETTFGGLHHIDAALQQHQPAIVILELGANDGLRGANPNDIEHNLNELVQRCRTAHAKMLLLGIQLPPNYGLTYTTQFKALYAKVAQRNRIAFVPFILAGISADQFQADNLHPVAEAQPQILRNVLPKLKPLL